MTDQDTPMIVMMNAGKALAIFKLALASTSVAGWFARKGSAEEDELYAAAHDVVLDALSDADATNVVDATTNQNWRDQLSVQDAINLDEERRLRRFGWRRN